MNKFVKNVENISKEDYINDLLLAICKLNDNVEYTTLAELLFILGKEQFFDLCAIMGGCELKIPTLRDLKEFISALYITDEMLRTFCSFDEAFEKCSEKPISKQRVKKIVVSLNEVKVDE